MNNALYSSKHNYFTSSTFLISIFLSLGILVFIFTSRTLYSIWLILSSFFPLGLVFFTNSRLFLRPQLPYILLILALGFLIDLVAYPLTPTSFFLLSSFSTALIVQRSYHTFYQLFLWLSRLSIAIFLFKYFVLSLPHDSIFLFSKNMIFLPFIPFLTLFLYVSSRSYPFVLSHHLTFWACILVTLSTLSIGNILLSIFTSAAYICILLTQSYSSLFVRSSLLVLSSFVLFSFLYFLPAYLNNNLNLASSSARAVLLDRSLDDLPRAQIFKSYSANIQSPVDFILGPASQITSFVLINKESAVRAIVQNPHNSLIYLHSRLGIAALLLYFLFILKAFLLFFDKQYSLSLFMMGVIIRSLSDDVLVPSGFAAFIPFFLLLLRTRNSYLRSHLINSF